MSVVAPPVRQSRFAELFPALLQLDVLLERAVGELHASLEPQAAGDAFRGLYVGADEVERLVRQGPGGARLWPNGHVDGHALDAVEDDARFGRLRERYELAPFDVQVLLIALAPEIDLRYERLYAYLQDDVTRRWPSVGLALDLLCPSIDERIEGRARFEPGTPLVRHGLIRLPAETGALEPPLLGRAIRPDEQVARFLLGNDGEDARLLPFCRLVAPDGRLDELPLPDGHAARLSALVGEARASGEALRMLFSGPRDRVKERAAAALADELDAPLLLADLARVPSDEAAFDEALPVLLREAELREALLFLDRVDGLAEGSRQERLGVALAAFQGIAILASERFVVIGTESVEVPFPLPAHAARRECLRAALDAAGTPLADDELETFTGRFRLRPGQIEAAARSARAGARWRSAGAESQAPNLHDLFAAARAQTGHELAALARKVEPVAGWGDIVLAEDALAQLRELCMRVALRQRVLGGWGFGARLSLGKGVNALFSGPSGAGKTMAAEVIAGELGLDLYRIDLSQVVSKYVGDTERNLERIFSAARDANVILFFDEADALFGKRSEVRDAHDRYANIEISYLLQQMDEYEGLSILATNLRRNMDDAFVRRLTFAVSFPQPDEGQRLRIWQGIWPPETPLADQVDLAFMARQFRFTGGNIRNIAVAAAFLAAEDDRPVGMPHLIRATRRELQKLSKVVGRQDFGEYACLLPDAAPVEEGAV